jgi:formylglycine-generating enzyme required for sulfatase activity
MVRTLRLCALAAVALGLAACNREKTVGGGSGATGGAPGAEDKPATITTPSGVSMVFIPAGTFTMGSAAGNADEGPAHQVSVSPFVMDATPVTNEMFAKAQLPNPSHWQDSPKQPVEQVPWHTAREYCDERSRAEGLRPCYDEKKAEWSCDYSASGYRLPTEAEWEYAAKAGKDGGYDFGSKDNLAQYAWFAENSDQKTHPVGEKRPNGFGLYDMYGNVSNWCEDVYDANYYQNSPKQDPHGPSSPGKDVKRVLRGGNWKASADLCRNSYRLGEHSSTDACFVSDYVGFRCVRAATLPELVRFSKSVAR